MIKQISVLFLICLYLTACRGHNRFFVDRPALTTVTIIDRNGISEIISNPERLCQYESIDFLKTQPYQKVLRIYGRNHCGDIKAYITTYHENGAPQQYLEIVNNRAFGKYMEWHHNGQLNIEALVIGGDPDVATGSEKTYLFDGVCKAWNEAGQQIGEIPYCKGELEGKTLHYHPNGSVWKEIPYHANKLEGIFYTYLDTGELLSTVNYTNGVRHGQSLRYWTADRLASQETFKEGYLVEGNYFDADGKEICRINEGKGYRAIMGKDHVAELQEYLFGLQEGEVKVFTKSGRLSEVYHVKNNRKHGEQINYYDTLNPLAPLVPKLAMNWYEGKLQGIVKTWYPHGVQESQREMTDNKKNGILTGWYGDGSLMLIEEYDRDKLVRGEYYKKSERIAISEISEGKGLATLHDADGNFLRKINYFNGRPND